MQAMGQRRPSLRNIYIFRPRWHLRASELHHFSGLLSFIVSQRSHFSDSVKWWWWWQIVTSLRGSGKCEDCLVQLRYCRVLVCPAKRWGRNCENFCRCEDAACDKATGCTSCSFFPGWRGPNCDQDIDECVNVRQSCGANSDCQNTNGSYICTCHPWYERLSGREERCICKCYLQPLFLIFTVEPRSLATLPVRRQWLPSPAHAHR